MPDNSTPAELFDRFVDDLINDLDSPVPSEFDPPTVELTRSVLRFEQQLPSSYAQIQTRVWQRILDGSTIPVGQGTSAVSVDRSARQNARGELGRIARSQEASGRGLAIVQEIFGSHASSKGHTWNSRTKLNPWLVRAAAMLLIVLVGGTALTLSQDVQAQVRRLGCLVPGLGVRACDSQGLVSMQAVSATSSQLFGEVIGLQGSSDGTLLRMRLRVPAPNLAGAGQEKSLEDSLPLIQEIQGLQTELRESSNRVLTPVAPDGQPWPGTSTSGVRSGHIVSVGIQPGNDGIYRLIVGVEWTFPPLDPNIRSVDVVVPATAGPLTLTVPLVPVKAAGLPVLGAEGAAVTQHGVALRVAGIVTSSSGVTVQVSARVEDAGERVVGLGQNEPGRSTPVLGRVLWDSQGHLHAEANVGPSDSRTQNDTYLQTLTFPTLAAGVHAATLEVPSVFVTDDSGAASITIPIAGRQVGDAIPLDTQLVLGTYPFRVHDATIQATSEGRELVVNLDFGDVQDGRALLGARTVQISGRDDLHPRVTGIDPTGQYRQLHAPLPMDIGDQVTLNFAGAFAEVRGPWQLPVPAGVGDDL